MELKDVKDVSQFQEFYTSNSLNTDIEKIERLKREMGILFTKYEGPIPPSQEVKILQQQVLEVWDRVSCMKKDVCKELS